MKVTVIIIYYIGQVNWLLKHRWKFSN